MRYGRGPKLVFVRRHPRWLNGKRKHVEDFRPRHDHKLGHRKTRLRLLTLGVTIPVCRWRSELYARPTALIVAGSWKSAVGSIGLRGGTMNGTRRAIKRCSHRIGGFGY